MRQDTFQKGKAAGDSEDSVDAIVGQWRSERPDLDPSSKEVTGRIVRLGSLFGQAYSEAFASLGLGDGDYGVLAALRRAGAPHRLTPTELARQRMMTSGGMTAAVDRLERRGLVARAPNPADRRGTLIGLTAAGRKVVDDAMELHAATEQRLVAGLGAREREQLAALLRKLLRSVEAS
jgi:DNA-binding MarR family transcriptional regulator